MDIVNSKQDFLKEGDTTGVYEIRLYNQTANFYAGKTSRKFQVKKSEDIADIKLDIPKTALSRLNGKETIKIDFENSRIISNKSPISLLAFICTNIFKCE